MQTHARAIHTHKHTDHNEHLHIWIKSRMRRRNNVSTNHTQKKNEMKRKEQKQTKSNMWPPCDMQWMINLEKVLYKCSEKASKRLDRKKIEKSDEETEGKREGKHSPQMFINSNQVCVPVPVRVCAVYMCSCLCVSMFVQLMCILLRIFWLVRSSNTICPSLFASKNFTSSMRKKRTDYFSSCEAIIIVNQRLAFGFMLILTLHHTNWAPQMVDWASKRKPLRFNWNESPFAW